MKRIARSAAFLVTIGGGAAAAADLPHPSYYTATAPLSAYSWTGPYLGGNLGYEWGITSNNPTRPSGFAGGAEAGYNWQTGQFVFGVEADIALSAANDTFAPWKFSNPWFGTVRARAGYAVSNFLIYGTAGVAFGELQAETFGLAS
jgi:outer membrane immunogenic protein